jgi:hypothetical protein
MMIEDDVAFWDTWTEDLLEAETEEEDRRLERRLAARHEADIEEMVGDLDRDPHPAPVERARRSPREVHRRGRAAEACRAGHRGHNANIEWQTSRPRVANRAESQQNRGLNLHVTVA